MARRPPTSTVQAPHWPWSQPFLAPVSSSCSRSTSSSVARVSTASSRRSPLIVSASSARLCVHAQGRYPLARSGNARAAARRPAAGRPTSAGGPVPGRITVRTFGGGWRSRATIRSCSGQASVTGTRISREPGEGVGAHRGVDRGEAGRGRVGADQVARRGGGHPVGVGDEHRHRDAPQRRHARDRPGERRRQPRGGPRAGRAAAAAAPATARPARSPRRCAPGRRARARARPSRRASCRRRRSPRPRARPARRRSPRRAAPASAPRPPAAASRRSRAGRPRSPRARRRAARVTGAHTRRSAPSGCRSTSGGPEPVRSRASSGAVAVVALTRSPRLRSGSRAGDSGRQCGLANSACESPIRCSAKPASQ